MKSVRTDLALEEHEQHGVGELEGVWVKEETRNRIKITRLGITDDRGAQKLQKPKGTYITLEFSSPEGWASEEITEAKEILSETLSELVPPNACNEVLAVGLGNRKITSDSIGPKVVEGLFVTRHLFEHLPEVLTDEMRPLAAVSPGVLGLTGMETGEIVRGVCDRIAPSLVIVIDALAARNVNRLARSVQISDTGITPGSGVGNHRAELSEKTLGVPVISIGVPMVIDAADLLSEEEFRPSKGAERTPFIVTPKDVDILSDRMADLVADAINLAVHRGVSLYDLENFMV